MEITIKINGRFVSVEVSAEVADYLEQARRNNRKLYRERQRYWDGRECDEYIIAAEGRLPYCATPEELVCQRETLDEILAVLALCTDTQRERFLLHITSSWTTRTPHWNFCRPFFSPFCSSSWSASLTVRRNSGAQCR